MSLKRSYEYMWIRAAQKTEKLKIKNWKRAILYAPIWIVILPRSHLFVIFGAIRIIVEYLDHWIVILTTMLQS